MATTKPSLVAGMYNAAEHPGPASRYLIAIWRSIPGLGVTMSPETQEDK
jgi:hypothetical protein